MAMLGRSKSNLWGEYELRAAEGNKDVPCGGGGGVGGGGKGIFW